MAPLLSVSSSNQTLPPKAPYLTVYGAVGVRFPLIDPITAPPPRGITRSEALAAAVVGGPYGPAPLPLRSTARLTGCPVPRTLPVSGRNPAWMTIVFAGAVALVSVTSAPVTGFV